MNLVKQDNRPLGLRLKSALRTKYGNGSTMPDTSCLLLDISYSMESRLATGTRKIDELRVMAKAFTDVRRFEFSSTCSELQPEEDVPEVAGGTALDLAFLCIKAKGITHVVLITDGEPDNEKRAKDAAAGLKIDAFYVGDDEDGPRNFLRELSEFSGGSYGKASLERVSELTASVRQRLQIEAPKRSIEL